MTPEEAGGGGGANGAAALGPKTPLTPKSAAAAAVVAAEPPRPSPGEAMVVLRLLSLIATDCPCVSAPQNAQCRQPYLLFIC